MPKSASSRTSTGGMTGSKPFRPAGLERPAHQRELEQHERRPSGRRTATRDARAASMSTSSSSSSRWSRAVWPRLADLAQDLVLVGAAVGSGRLGSRRERRVELLDLATSASCIPFHASRATSRISAIARRRPRPSASPRRSASLASFLPRELLEPGGSSRRRASSSRTRSQRAASAVAAARERRRGPASGSRGSASGRARGRTRRVYPPASLARPWPWRRDVVLLVARLARVLREERGDRPPRRRPTAMFAGMIAPGEAAVADRERRRRLCSLRTLKFGPLVRSPPASCPSGLEPWAAALEVWQPLAALLEEVRRRSAPVSVSDFPPYPAPMDGSQAAAPDEDREARPNASDESSGSLMGRAYYPPPVRRYPALGTLRSTPGRSLAGCGGDDDPGRGGPPWASRRAALRVKGRVLVRPRAHRRRGRRGTADLEYRERRLAGPQPAVATGSRCWRGPRLPGRRAKSFTIRLAPGDLQIVCTVGDHADLGMVGELDRSPLSHCRRSDGPDHATAKRVCPGVRRTCGAWAASCGRATVALHLRAREPARANGEVRRPRRPTQHGGPERNIGAVPRPPRAATPNAQAVAAPRQSGRCEREPSPRLVARVADLEHQQVAVEAGPQLHAVFLRGRAVDDRVGHGLADREPDVEASGLGQAESLRVLSGPFSWSPSIAISARIGDCAHPPARSPACPVQTAHAPCQGRLSTAQSCYVPVFVIDESPDHADLFGAAQTPPLWWRAARG